MTSAVNMELAPEASTGYDCEFVEAVSRDTQTDCPICLHILRQPHLVECCGHRFCKACLERIQGLEAPCPLCTRKITKAIADKQLERCLKEKQVYCSNKAYGCSWTGELGQFEEGHLNATPPQGKLMDGCLYVEVLCSQCQRMKVKRLTMENHIQKECPRRIAVCTYCKEYHAAYENVSRIHHLVCSYVPQPCPKGCGAKPLRKNITTHVMNWCPKNTHPCPFHIVGCMKNLTKKEMKGHLKDRAAFTSHLSALEMTVCTLQNEIGKKDIQIKTLQKDLKGKDIQFIDLLSETEKKELDMCMVTERKDELISILKDELAACENHISILQGQVRDKEQECDILREKLARAEEVCAHEVQDKTAALEEKASLVSALSKEVKKKSQQFIKLKNKSAHDEQALRRLKNENTELQMYTCSLETKIIGMSNDLGTLNDEAYIKAFHAETLERKVTELQQVIQAQKHDIERLTRTAERRYEKFSKADKREEIQHDLQDVIDGSYSTRACGGIVPTREENRGPPEQPPADDSGVLGAALGVAVGVGIAGIAALLRR